MALHSFLAAVVLYAWARHLELPSGRAKRLLLALVLVLPLATAAVPGRDAPTFRDRLAWVDSERVLQLPVVPFGPDGFWSGLRVVHLALAAAAVTAGVTVVQELLPVLGRLTPRGDPVPVEMGRFARALPGWERLRIDVVDEEGPLVATTGVPGRARLLVSPRALQLLHRDEMRAVLRHEHAHWIRGRWLLVHLLFAARAVQFYNPVALWVFRHFTLEYEIACDRDAVAGASPKPLVRALLLFYEATHPRDVAARRALRHRVEALRGRLPVDDGALPPGSVAAAAILLLVLLPWVV
ncbi:MAG: M56 family metallopeptidase [Acidobacteriota bacterium]